MQATPQNVPSQGVGTLEKSAARRPESGALPLPMLTLDQDVYRTNRDTIIRYGERHGALLAPHVKTAMIPELAVDLIAAGGWGVTVADVRQAAVMIGAGIRRIILANEVGIHGARRFARLAADHPEVELLVFADSVEAVEALANAWQAARPARRLVVLMEVGAGRAGARDIDAFSRVLDAAVLAEKEGGIFAAGVAAYEGASALGGADEAIRRVDALMILQGEALARLRQAVGPQRRLIASAGGSMYFDRVVALLGDAVKADGNADLVIRPGAILFGDHGLYERAFKAMDARRGFEMDAFLAANAFRPVLRVWAKVLSRPEAGLAICGIGMRDVSHDAGLPRTLRIFRGGVELETDVTKATVTRLNDQHAFVALGNANLKVGDIVEFGISHPCTCLHLWRMVHVLDKGAITGEMLTRFG